MGSKIYEWQVVFFMNDARHINAIGLFTQVNIEYHRIRRVFAELKQCFLGIVSNARNMKVYIIEALLNIGSDQGIVLHNQYPDLTHTGCTNLYFVIFIWTSVPLLPFTLSSAFIFCAKERTSW